MQTFREFVEELNKHLPPIKEDNDKYKQKEVEKDD